MITIVLFAIAAVSLQYLYHLVKVDILGIKPADKVRNSPVKPKLKKKATPKQPNAPRQAAQSVWVDGVEYRRV